MRACLYQMAVTVVALSTALACTQLGGIRRGTQCLAQSASSTESRAHVFFATPNFWLALLLLELRDCRLAKTVRSAHPGRISGSHC